ncbi:MAG: hypothetical protein OXF11_15305 [Deltaproteobacteria bacterium]|nr:hypothetical protein [Deltaproteobacteria bacterium]
MRRATQDCGRKDLTLAAASLAIGRNKTSLQQYVDRGVPAVLGYRDSETLAERLGRQPLLPVSVSCRNADRTSLAVPVETRAKRPVAGVVPRRSSI